MKIEIIHTDSGKVLVLKNNEVVAELHWDKWEYGRMPYNLEQAIMDALNMNRTGD